MSETPSDARLRLKTDGCFSVDWDGGWVESRPIKYCTFPSEQTDRYGEPYNCEEPAIAEIAWYNKATDYVCRKHHNLVIRDYLTTVHFKEN